MYKISLADNEGLYEKISSKLSTIMTDETVKFYDAVLNLDYNKEEDSQLQSTLFNLSTTSKIYKFNEEVMSKYRGTLVYGSNPHLIFNTKDDFMLFLVSEL